MSRSILVLLSVAGVILVACTYALSGKNGSAKDRSETAHKMVAEGAMLLDVRTREEYADGHLPGAVNIPVGELKSRLSEISKDQSVVAYCRSGRRSDQAIQILTDAGYKAFNLGGKSDW